MEEVDVIWPPAMIQKALPADVMQTGRRLRLDNPDCIFQWLGPDLRWVTEQWLPDEDDSQMDSRRARVLAMIDTSKMRGLEIGPLDRPVVTRDMGPIAYADHASTDELRGKYGGDPSVEPSRIVEVDHVFGDLLVDVVGVGQFDYVVASHVIEHVPDLVGWLKDVASVIRPGGVLSLVIPDKRYTFDYLRPVSRAAAMVDSYLIGPVRPSFGQVLESVAMSVNLEVEEAWAGSPHPLTVGFRHTEDTALAEALRARDGEYVDVHTWVLTPQSFFDCLRFLIRLGLFDYRVVHYIPTSPGDLEFFVALERLDPDLEGKEAIQLESIPLVESEQRWDRFGFDHALTGTDQVAAKISAVMAELEEERQSGPRRWINQLRWSERFRLALPQRWGILDRAMKSRW